MGGIRVALMLSHGHAKLNPRRQSPAFGTMAVLTTSLSRQGRVDNGLKGYI